MDLRDKLTQAQLPGLLNRYAQIVTAVKQFFPQFQLDTSPLGIVMKDGFATLDVNTKLLNLAMQDLIDIEKEKGITGIYNLPEGATFYVPVSAYELDQQTRAMGGGGGSYLDPGVFSGFKADMEALANAILKEKMGGTEEGPRIVGNTANVLKAIVTGGIESPLQRSRMGVTGPAQYLPIEDLKEILIQSGISMREPKPTVNLDTERNTLLAGIKGEADNFTIGLQTLNTTVSSILTLISSGKIASGEIDIPGPKTRPTLGGLRNAEAQAKPEPSFIERLLSFLKEFIILGGTTQPLMPVAPKPPGDTSLLPNQLDRIPMAIQVAAPQEPMTTRLNLSLESTTQLVVDGRTLANIIKPYLYEDLLRYESTGSVIIKRNMI
jgi:hypothetical protein